MKLSERLEEMAGRSMFGMEEFRALLGEAAELARGVEDAEIAEPAMQSGHLVSVIVREGAHYKGQRLRLVPVDGQGGGRG